MPFGSVCHRPPAENRVVLSSDRPGLPPRLPAAQLWCFQQEHLFLLTRPTARPAATPSGGVAGWPGRRAPIRAAAGSHRHVFAAAAPERRTHPGGHDRPVRGGAEGRRAGVYRRTRRPARPGSGGHVARRPPPERRGPQRRDGGAGDRRTWWEWGFRSETAVLHVIRPSRAVDVIEEVMGPARVGPWVCDCWKPQLRAPADRSQLCLALPIRNLKGPIERAPRLQGARERQALFREATHLAKRRAGPSGRGFARRRTEIERRLARPATTPAAQAPLKRYRDQRAHLLVFLHDPAVTFALFPLPVRANGIYPTRAVARARPHSRAPAHARPREEGQHQQRGDSGKARFHGWRRCSESAPEISRLKAPPGSMMGWTCRGG